LQALSQLVAVQNALGEQFDESTVEVFGQGAVLLYHRVAQDQRTMGWAGLRSRSVDDGIFLQAEANLEWPMMVTSPRRPGPGARRRWPACCQTLIAAPAAQPSRGHPQLTVKCSPDR